ncbi:sensor histidine kinase [Nocardia testacea]|uniref:sensor histidine kinase n=1 Tax=Nocardia testacea TaxID=248551 RepID=UPI00030760D0|nr:sensor histidine kinase [Nocardia testacea]
MNTTHTVTPRALAWSLHVLVLALLVLAVGRAVAGHHPHAGAVAAAAAACGLVYAGGSVLPAVRTSGRAAAVWLAVLVCAWLALLVISADGVWVAFPLYFLQLHLLPRRAGIAAVAATAVVAAIGFAAHQSTFGAPMVIGPALGAAVAVAVVRGYQALYRESERRRQLIEELTATRAELAAAEHAAGVLAERERLAREIHDTLAQGLTSIQLLLGAAERVLPGAPDSALRYIGQARQTAVDDLAEARRFVAALTPPALEGASLADALERLCAATGARHGITAHFHRDGTPVPMPISHEVALLRIAQSALANTVRHAAAASADIVLRYLGDRVVLSIADDGCGFDPAGSTATGDGGGFGLASMSDRVTVLGGELTVESAAGEGTTLTARLPLGPAPAGVEESA